MLHNYYIVRPIKGGTVKLSIDTLLLALMFMVLYVFTIVAMLLTRLLIG